MADQSDRLAFQIALVLVVLCAACGGDDEANAPRCTPGTSQACDCVVGNGAQTCEDDGRFATCSCVPPIGGRDAGGLDAGTVELDSAMDDATTADTGNVDLDAMSPPEDVGPIARWLHVSAGSRATCAVRNDFTAQCWGETAAVTELPTDRRFSFIGTDGDNACGIDADEGWLRCWGEDAWTDTVSDLEAYRGRVIDLRCGTYGCCALTNADGSVCFGGPMSVARIDSIAMSVVSRHSCVVASDGNIACSFFGGIAPTPPRGGWSSVAAIGESACGVVRDTGETLCGESGSARLEGRAVSHIEGSPVGTLCGLLRDTSLVHCERRRALGGDEPIADMFRDDEALRELSLGIEHACGITLDGRLVCWGRNGNRQIPPSGSI